MKPNRWLSAVCALSLFAACAAGAAEHELVIYGTRGHDITVMVELAKAILEGDGRVIPDAAGGRMLVMASPASHARLRQAFEHGYATTRNVQLTVMINEEGQQRETGASIAGAVQIGSDGTRIQVTPSVRHQTSESSRAVDQMLVTRSGSEATLRVGDVLPVLEWTYEYRRYHPSIHVGTRWLEAGAFLTFRPTVQPDGETIHLLLTPEIRGRSPDGHPLAYRFTTIQTEIVARDGQTVQIGGWSEAGQLFSRFLIGLRHVENRNAITIHITPRILP